MGKTVRRRHNRDGSVTKTTTYSRRNIFGTRITDTYTERIDPNQAQNTSHQNTKLRASNSIAIVFLVIAIFVVPVLGISLSWNADFITGFIKFSLISFTIYMLINNIAPLRRLVISCWKKNRLATGIGVAVTVGVIAIVSAVTNQNGDNRNEVPSAATNIATEAEIAHSANTTATEVELPNEYAEDDTVNRFITEYNDFSAYPMTDISQGNIRTKYFCYANDCRIEILNANKAAAERFYVTIDADNTEGNKEKIFVVFKDMIKALDTSLSDEQIDNVVTEFSNGGTYVEEFSLGDNIVVSYSPPLHMTLGKYIYRIEISVENYTE